MELLNYNLTAHVSFNDESIEKVLKLCEEAINNLTVDDTIRFKLQSAVHELVVNSLEHGYKKGSGDICITIKKQQGSIFFEICDVGVGIDPESLNLNRQAVSLESTTSRGWGLAILNNFADSMQILPNSPSGTRVVLTISA